MNVSLGPHSMVGGWDQKPFYASMDGESHCAVWDTRKKKLFTYASKRRVENVRRQKSINGFWYTMPSAYLELINKGDELGSDGEQSFMETKFMEAQTSMAIVEEFIMSLLDFLFIFIWDVVEVNSWNWNVWGFN